MNERMLIKSTSARFLMAVICTFFACLLTLVVVIKYPEGASQVTSGFFTVWGIIVTFYFSKGGEKKEDPKP